MIKLFQDLNTLKAKVSGITFKNWFTLLTEPGAFLKVAAVLALILVE